MKMKGSKKAISEFSSASTDGIQSRRRNETLETSDSEGWQI